MGFLSRMRELIRGASTGAPSGARDDRPWWDRDEPPWPPQFRDVPATQRVVDNRVFLIGLDELYRTAMKKHERAELLGCAERVASALNVPPASVPIEGYYTEHPDLTAYFQFMRALQSVPLERASEVESLPEFSRLLAVTSSPIYGLPVRKFLLPAGRDPLSAALHPGTAWTVPLLTAAAAKIARETEGYSLVGLAARTEDPVALAALRESVVLYAEIVTGMAVMLSRPEYVWTVDSELAAAAQRFVDAFNALFGPELPPPIAKYAGVFWAAFSEANVVGRCVRLGQTPTAPTLPQRFYHWAVVAGPADQLAVHEFWDERVWTTSEYRARRP